MLGELLTEQEVADIMRVSIHAVRKWRRKGRIAYIKVDQTIRFRPQDVVRFIESGRHGALCPSCEASRVQQLAV